jgi:hypothetical protein
MSLDLRYKSLQDALIRLLRKSRWKGKNSSASLDLDDALLELEAWHDLVVNRPEAFHRDAEACHLTHLALDTAFDACQTLETSAGMGISSIDERYVSVCF